MDDAHTWVAEGTRWQYWHDTKLILFLFVLQIFFKMDDAHTWVAEGTRWQYWHDTKLILFLFVLQIFFKMDDAHTWVAEGTRWQYWHDTKLILFLFVLQIFFKMDCLSVVSGIKHWIEMNTGNLLLLLWGSQHAKNYHFCLIIIIIITIIIIIITITAKSGQHTAHQSCIKTRIDLAWKLSGLGCYCHFDCLCQLVRFIRHANLSWQTFWCQKCKQISQCWSLFTFSRIRIPVSWRWYAL